MKALTRRPYQEKCLVKIVRRFKEGINRLLVVWSTGLGKTVLFAGLPETLELGIRLASSNRHRMLVLVHRDELITQAVDAIREWNPSLSVGIERGDEVAKDYHQVVVASVPTLGREDSTRLFRYQAEEFGAVVVDEVHHAVADTYQRILDYFRVYDNKNILLLGVTATPNRADGKGLGKIFQEIVDHITILWAIKHGWLVDMSHGKLIVPGSSLDAVKRLSSDNEVASAIDSSATNDFVARGWAQEAAHLKTIMFCANVDHAKNMAAAFRRIGVGAEAIWADDPARAEKIAKHKSGEIKVLCNVNILIEGYDDRDIECVALNRPTDSASLYTQMIGRGARLPNQLKDLGYDNLLEALEAGHKIRKTKCLVLDFVYATRKHKLVFLPNLLGLAPGFDMDGKSLAEVGEMIEKVKERKPKFNLATAAGFGSLEILVHNVDLLKVDYSPEVKELSQNQWIAHDDSYVLMMPRKDRLVIVPAKDRTWTVSGMVNGKDILKYKLQTLREAFKYADTQIRILGGLTAVSGVRREGASWHNEPANASQIRLAELAGIKVPPGTTRGDLSKKINEAMVKSRDAVRKLKDEMEGKRW